ncbi:MAG TPA: rhodanese family protein [Geminicoccaceae bacterium]
MTEPRLREVDPKTLKDWIDQDRAVLVDIREADEFAREHIEGARLAPLSSFDAHDFRGDHDRVGVFHCSSGTRTAQAAPEILRTGFAEVYALSGGLQAWKKAGLPVNRNRPAPLPIMRQVQITAGVLVLIGVALAVLVSPWFMTLSAFVGAGLMLAGITGFCGMANLLALMPWNRMRVPEAAAAHG